MKIVVSKANFGGRNSVKWHNLFEKDPRGEVGYYYFTDQSMSSEPVHELRERGVSVAEINFNNCIIDHPLGNLEYQKRRQAKLYKIMPDLFVGGADYYIWMDAYFEMAMNPIDIITNSGFDKSDSHIAFFKHSSRDCLFDEMDLIKDISYDSSSSLDLKRMFYQNPNFQYPKNNGLYECTCFIMKNTFESKLIRMEWLNHMNRFSSRDQVSLPFVLTQLNQEPHILEGKILPGKPGDNPYFISSGNN